jgi:hypothetical protein
MPEILELPVRYKEVDLLLPMELVRWGYTHRFKIMIEEVSYFFEPDEEGNYRAMIDEGLPHRSDNTALLKLVGETLAALMS